MERRNEYRYRFIAHCEVNDLPIAYDLYIETDGRMITVEELQETCTGIKKGMHEGIADTLHEKFGGTQILKAHHHGVDIETTRR